MKPVVVMHPRAVGQVISLIRRPGRWLLERVNFIGASRVSFLFRPEENNDESRHHTADEGRPQDR